MIYPQTLLSVVDNTGVSIVKCISSFSKKYNCSVKPFDVFKSVVKVSNVKKRINKKQFKKGIVVDTLFVGSCKSVENNKNSGIYIKYFKNNAVLLEYKKKEYTFLSNRVHVPIPFKVKSKHFSKVRLGIIIKLI